MQNVNSIIYPDSKSILTELGSLYSSLQPTASSIF